ncbi:MAG: c-type cytochrome [Chitinophagales bacterium]|nr:c-type cytochrome [Chitinophagales bacterium]
MTEESRFPRRIQAYLLPLLLVFIFNLQIYAQDEEAVVVDETETVVADASEDAGIDKAIWDEGKKLFRANCASCHHPINNMTGPALKGALNRWEGQDDYQGITGKEWMYRWIRNWNEPVNDGMPYAIAMKDYDPSVMNLFIALTDEEIDNIVYYTDNSDWKPATAGGPAISEVETKTDSGIFKTLLLLLIGVLIMIALILGRVSTVLNRLVIEKEGGIAPQRVPIYKSKALITALVLAAFIFVAFELADGAISLGRQQGYQPAQPIAFSHKLHAGKYNIDCQYCHHSASQSKHSNIPSVDVCMNCHKAVQQGPTGNKEEIEKIYAAADYDVFSQEYGPDPNPIEWVRIHNLPDHVYFNHQQHVVAGNLECQTCHGPIEEMEEVYQYAPLSMGWCINCHRETQVQFASNDYYELYKKLHDKGKFDEITVETIGGTECQKCHY